MLYKEKAIPLSDAKNNIFILGTEETILQIKKKVLSQTLIGVEFNRMNSSVNDSTSVRAFFLFGLLVSETFASCRIEILIRFLTPTASRSALQRKKNQII